MNIHIARSNSGVRTRNSLKKMVSQMAGKDQSTAGNGLVPDDSTTGAISALPPHQRMIREMASMATLEDAAERFLGDELDRILEAENESDMWESDDFPQYNAKVLSGCEIEIISFAVKFSRGDNEEIQSVFVDPETGKQMYLLITATRLNDTGKNKRTMRLPEIGTEFVWNTSAPRIVTKFWWLLKNGHFDNHATVKARIEGTDLGGGKSVEKLKPLTPVTITERGRRGKASIITADTSSGGTDTSTPPF